MTKAIGATVAAGLFCFTLVLGSASQARAQVDCTTQGDLALALAQLIDKTITTKADAASALSAIGVEPAGGWKIDPPVCLTQEVIDQVTAAYADAVDKRRREGLVAGNVGVALEVLGPPDRKYPSVSNISPSGQ